MKTVGQILQEERKKQKITLDEIARDTKIPLPTLEKIENNDFQHLPPATFTKGFLRNFAKYLKLEPARILAIFRRDFVETNKGTILPKTAEPPGESGFNPRTFSIAGIGLAIGLILVYVVLQLRTMLLPPKVVLDPWPAETEDETITLQGKVNREAVVTVNNDLILLEEKKFQHPVKLEPGANKFVIKAVDRRKKETRIEIEIKRIE